VGTVFSIGTGGGSLSTLGTFASSGPWYPIEGVIESSNYASDHNLWGVTSYNSTSGYGALYTLDTSSGTVTTQHSFTGAPSDGGTPYGRLLRDSTTDYGVTNNGGTTNSGTLYSMTESGTYSTVHNFNTKIALDTHVGTGANSGTSLTLSLTTTKPNELVIANIDNATSSTSSDSVSNVTSGGTSYSWTKLVGTNNGMNHQEIWYIVIPTPVSSQTVTFTFPASQANAVNMDAYIGADTVTPIDATPVSTNFTSVYTSSSTVTTTSGHSSYVLGYAAFSGGAVSFSAGSGYTQTSGGHWNNTYSYASDAYGEMANSLSAGGSSVTVSAQYNAIGSPQFTSTGVLTAVPIRIQEAH